MSVQMMGEVFTRSRSKGTARLVLLALADQASKIGDVSAYHRSRSYLAEACNCSESSVKRAITDLIELGEIEVTRVGTGRESSDYRILWRSFSGGVMVDPPRDSTDDHPGGTPLTTQEVRPRPPRGVDHEAPIIPLDPLHPVLPGTEAAAPPPSPKVKPPEHVIAETVWQRSSPKPATPFIAARKIAGKLLEAGHTSEAIITAMLAARTISTGSVEFELNRNRPARSPVDSSQFVSRDAEPGVVSAEELFA